MAAIPFLTTYDPPGSSEGTLDPLGLYQIADQLATRLVPAVRERMQRVRFLTVMSLGSQVTEGLDGDPDQPEARPFLVWEWLVVEAIIRTLSDDPEVWGVPGTLVTRRAREDYGYLDHRSYLKTPRIFGFHGVYKRLAIHLRLVDVHLGPRPEGEQLVDAWARDAGLGGLLGCRPLLDKWRRAVERSLACNPARTRPGWKGDDWEELAEAVVPHCAGRRERRYLREALHGADDRALGALPAIWRLQKEFADEDFAEEPLHERLAEELPRYATLLQAIRAYELFCRSLHDGFDLLRAEAAAADARGFEITSIGHDGEFAASLHGLDRRYEHARRWLSEVDLQIAGLFDERFGEFAEPMSPDQCALVMCEHHEKIQKHKSADGKRPWFDRLGRDRIYMRHRYREVRRPIAPGRFVHQYRGWPIRRFCRDLT
jgi:hypothetical protein